MELSNSQAKRTVYRMVVGMSFLLMSIGIVYLCLTLYEFSQGSFSSKWPYVTGIITESRISTYSSIQASGTNRSNHDSISHKPVISYKYTINNNEYTNDKIKFGGVGGSNERLSNQYTNQYQVGDKVRVYYSERYPDDSVLIRGTTKTNLLAILGSLVFFVFGAVMYRRRELFIKGMPD